MKIKNLIPIHLLFALFIFSAQAQEIKLTTADFIPFIGVWKGTLTYVDYTSGKPYTMPANVSISQIDKSFNYLFSKQYPDEPKANSTDTLHISMNGQRIDDEKITEIKREKDGFIEIITELTSVDGNENKPAIIRHTYKATNISLLIAKEVKFVGENTWIKRNENKYQK
jgi:hypothetical protein